MEGSMSTYMPQRMRVIVALLLAGAVGACQPQSATAPTPFLPTPSVQAPGTAFPSPSAVPTAATAVPGTTPAPSPPIAAIEPIAAALPSGFMALDQAIFASFELPPV